MFDSGFTSDFTRKVGDFGGQLSVIPFNGFKAVGDATLIKGGGGTDFKLGSLQVGGDTQGELGGDAGLCLGSAQATTSCGGNLAFASLTAPVQGGVHFGDPATDDLSFNFPTNLAVAAGNGSFSVTGDVGGTVKVGSVELGRVIPIDFQIPRVSTMMSSSSSRQAQSVRDSFLAVPRKSASDNGSSSTGRHARDAVSEAVGNVKHAVANAVTPKHAKPASAD